MPNFDEFDRKVNVAYDLSLFEPQPKEIPKKKNNIIEMPRQRVNKMQGVWKTSFVYPLQYLL